MEKSFQWGCFLLRDIFGKISGGYFLQIIFASAFLFFVNKGSGQVISWDFGTETGTSSPSVTTSHVTASDLFQGNNNGTTAFITTTSSSSGYTDASRFYNAQAAALPQTLDPSISTYFEFSLTPETGYSVTLNNISFGSRSTGTGPQSCSIRYSLDSYNTDVIAGVFPNDSKWYLYTFENLSLVNDNTITIRIYGFDGVNANNNTAVWRIDDLTLSVDATPIKSFFRSRQDGDWSVANTWQSSTDNVNWNTAVTSPTKEAETILIQSGHTVKITTPVSLDQTIVEGTLELQTGGVLNINDGEGNDIDIAANGILQIISEQDYTTAVQQSMDAAINIQTDGKIEIGDGSSSTGDGYEAFATSENNIWNDGAVYDYNNNDAFEIAGLTYFPNAASTDIPIFRITKVGGTIPAGSGNNFLLNGLLELNTDVTFTGAGRKSFKNGIKGTKTITQNSGKFYLTENAILDGTSLKIVLDAVMDLSPNTTIPVGANVTISGKNVSNGGVLTVDGTLDVTTININNAGDLVIVDGTYKTAHPGGFSGDLSSIPSKSGSVNLNPGSTVELYANGPQALKARDDFSNLIFSGSGIKTPSNGFVPVGTVTIKDDATLDCNGKNIGDESTNLTMSGNSRLIVSSYGPNPAMDGTYSLSGGVIQFDGSDGTPETIRNKSYQNIEVTGSNVLMSEGTIFLNAEGTFTVKDGGVFSINDNTISGDGSGTQKVIVESGGIFKCGTNLGFNGAEITSAPIYSSAIHLNITNIILEPNSTVEYTRTGDQPITNADGLIYQNLVLTGSGNKTAPSGDLIIQGDFSKTSTATFVHNNGTVIFNGTDLQTCSSVSPQTVFNNFRNENTSGLNINGSLSVYKQLFLADNSVINLNADISLLSDKDQTAYLSRLGTNANINYNDGRFIAERYINTNTINGGHEKSWQFISTPASGETIFNTWQEKGNKDISGYGIWITGASGTGGGFDAVSPAPSMKYYDAPTNSWIGISGTNINLENEKGYMVFIRGDRKTRTVNAAPTPTVLRTRGKLYCGDVLPPASIVPAGKFQSIGNPYVSAIDFSKVIRDDNISTSYFAWDPTLYGTYGYGGYQTISATLNYTAIPGNTSNYNTISDYRNIQSGQAFFVSNNSSTDGAVSFTEDCKLDDENHLVNRATEIKRPVLFASLFLQSGKIADGNAVAFDEKYDDGIDVNDAIKINNGGENFGIKRDNKILVIEARHKIKSNDTIFYYMNHLLKQDYKLSFNPKNMRSGLEAYLIDQYLKKKSQVSLLDTSVITFSVTSDPASAKANRFLLIFKPAAAPIALSPFSINAYQQNAHVFLEWKTENVAEIKHFQVEHSVDGIHFSVIKIVAANNFLTDYNFVHTAPFNGNNFYRIGRLLTNGKLEYSPIVNVVMPQLNTGIFVYPKAINGGKMSLQFMNQASGKYIFRFYNSIGQLIVSNEIIYPGGSFLRTVPLQRSVANGVYLLQIIKPSGEKVFIKVIK